MQTFGVWGGGLADNGLWERLLRATGAPQVRRSPK